jgi:hypothetical protein
MISAEGNMKMKNGVFWVVTPCGSCKNLVRTQKTPFFIVTAVKTSNLTNMKIFMYTLIP